MAYFALTALSTAQGPPAPPSTSLPPEVVLPGPGRQPGVYDPDRLRASLAPSHSGAGAADDVWRVRRARGHVVRRLRARSGPVALSGGCKAGLPHSLSGGIPADLGCHPV